VYSEIAITRAARARPDRAVRVKYATFDRSCSCGCVKNVGSWNVTTAGHFNPVGSV
jgi:hypothetical protein